MFKGICFCYLIAASFCSYADSTVIYPKAESATDTRFADLVDILKMALDKSTPKYGPYKAMPSKSTMNEARELDSLKDGNELNVVWSSTSEEKERDFIPIRIPLRKGLLGFRVALISKDKQDTIDKVKSLDDLRKLTIGQGIGWGDVKLYESNGLKVHTAQYENLFQMAAEGHIDLFPRGIGEAFSEYDAHKASVSALAVEQHLLIEYPWPYYFFFNKRDTTLAERIESGLRIMISDGSFDAIFKKYNGAAIERANLKQRRVIHVTNPLLPKATPISNQSLWFDPAKGL